MSASSATDTLLTSLASNSVDSSSSLGIDVLLTGETRVFDTTKLTVVPALPSTLRYTTAAYAPAEASQTTVAFFYG